MKLPNDEYPKLKPRDRQMLKLMSLLKAAGQIRTNQDFADAVGILKQNIVTVRNGTQSFSIEHIEAACREYGVNANWILGIEKEVFRFLKNKVNTEIILDQIGQNGVGARANVKSAANTGANKRAQKSNI